MRVKSTEEDTPFVTLPRVLSALALVTFALLFPTTSYAQATLAGVVRDSSGAVLPGVTVEAASPALIEKVRTAVTDGTGQYQIVDLRPGTYTVTFSLSGSAGVKREDVAGQRRRRHHGQRRAERRRCHRDAHVIQAKRRSSTIADTFVVRPCSRTRRSPSSRRSRLRRHSRRDSDPAGRRRELIVVGQPELLQRARRPRQRRARDGRRLERRRGVQRRRRVRQRLRHRQRTGNADLAFPVSLGEAEIGGPMLNIVPKTGGNNFKGTVFGTGAGEWAQGNNVDAALRGVRASPRRPALIKLWDVSFAMGGPIKTRQVVVLCQLPRLRQPHRHPGLYAQLVRGRRVTLGLRTGSERQDAHSDVEDRHLDAPDHAG